jgi:acyl phosphate:glycerol-3-phosphate acyltransferase
MVVAEAGVSVPAVVVAAVLGYLLGSIPVAVIVARRRWLDPRELGDGNPGYWNVKEQIGRSAAIPVFIGDAAKGALAGAIGLALDQSAWGIAYVAVGAAMIGHAYPVFARFRGGRSILTFAGGMLVLSPLAAAIAIVALLVVWAATRSFAIAARVGVFGFPVAQLLVESKERVAATGALMCIIGLRFAQAALRDRDHDSV